MTKYKGWFEVWENEGYVVTVCVVVFAVSGVSSVHPVT
jgi:hypothetical protein